MYNNDLPLQVLEAFITMYSDDTSLVVSADTAADLEFVANTILKKTAKWFATSKLTLNETKSNYIIYGTKEAVNLKMADAGLQQVHTGSTKLLGIELQPDGKFDIHVKKLLAKLAGAAFALRQVRHKLPKHLKILVYRALLESHLRYALPLWGPSLNVTTIKKIEKFQKRALRTVEGLSYNAHVDPIFKKYGVLKFSDLLRTELQLLMYDAKNENLPKRLTHLLLGVEHERSGLRADTEARARRGARDPPLVNTLRATWNLLETYQRQYEDRNELKNDLRWSAQRDYNTVCTRQDCQDCGQLTAMEREHRRLDSMARQRLTQEQYRELQAGGLYSDFGIL